METTQLQHRLDQVALPAEWSLTLLGGNISKAFNKVATEVGKGA